MVREFKEFISRGNVLDLAIAVIIGGAVGKIVASLVNDIMMPLLGIVLGGISFKNLKATIGSATINYGVFLQSIVDFLIIAVCIFLFVKLIKTVKKERVKEIEPPPEPSKEEILLTEIRDLLKKDRQQD